MVNSQEIGNSFEKTRGDRVKEVRVEVCGERGRSAFARKLGVNESNVRGYEEGRVLPAEVGLAISKIANININWLLTGDGEKYIIKESVEEGIPESIPIMGVSAKGGIGKTRKEAVKIEEVGMLKNKPGHKGAELKAFCITGSSMSPMFKAGVFVVIDMEKSPVYGQPCIYAMKHSNEVECKFCIPGEVVFEFYGMDRVKTEMPTEHIAWVHPIIGTI